MAANPYEVLGVKAQASQAEIKNAYRDLAKQLHPDLNPGNKKSETRFKEINEAYEKVGTQEARTKFDKGEVDAQAEARSREQAHERAYYHQTQNRPNGEQGRYSQSFSGIDEDFFESLFKGQKESRGRERQQPKEESFQMTIDFKDSILGTEKEIGLPNGKRFQAKIPAGIESGKVLRFAGVLVEVQVTPSQIFSRQGDHIEIEVPISTTESILGGEIKVPTLDGSVLLKVPASVSSGQKLRVVGKGVSGKGDQLVKLKIVNPDPKTSAFDEELNQAVRAWSLRHPYNPRDLKQ